MIHYLPLEHLDTRYTSHLDRSITSFLENGRIAHVRHYPSMDGRERELPPEGHFLNARGTIEFKARQLASVAPQLQDGDIVWCSDLWFPGLEGLAYLAHFAKLDVKIRGLLHAGSFTDTDFVRDLERWAGPFENILFDIVDRVYVGSKFVRADVLRKRALDPRKIVSTGFPLDPDLDELPIRPWDDRHPIVVFNGRLCDEKQPWLVDQLASELVRRGVVAEFVVTQDRPRARWEYLALLARAQVVVSFALQENFGFGVLEAVRLGCVPVVPDRLVYPELFAREYRYRTFRECCDTVERALRGQLAAPRVGMFEDAPALWFAGAS